MSLDTLIRKALDSGVELTLIDGAVKVTGHRAAVQQWRDQLRQHKAEIFARLSAANDPEPPPDPTAWRELAQEYDRHHFSCPACIAAGQGRGLRCGVGASLWTAYQTQLN